MTVDAKLGNKLEVGNAKIPLNKLYKGEEKNMELEFDEGLVSIVVIARDFGKEKGPEKIKKSTRKAPTNSLAVRPSDDEILKRFEEIKDSINMSEKDKSLSIDNKWLLVSNWKKNESMDNTEEFFKLLSEEFSIQNVEKLGFLFLHKPIHWLNKWHELGGNDLLIRNLKKMLRNKKKDGDSGRKKNGDSDENSMKEQILNTIYNFTNNNNEGLTNLTRAKDAINTLIQFLFDDSLSEETRLLVYRLLSVLCLFPESHSRIMSAFEKFKSQKKEEHRFQTLLSLLLSSNSKKLQVSIMTFLHATTNGPADIEFREFIRKELDDHNFKDILKKISSSVEDTDDTLELEDQIKNYEETIEEDIKIMKNRFHHLDDPDINFSNLEEEEIYNKIKKIIDSRELNEYFTELLRDILGIDPNDKNFKPKWALVTKVARQVSQMGKKKMKIIKHYLIK